MWNWLKKLFKRKPSLREQCVAAYGEEFGEMIQAVRNTEKVLGKVDYTVNQQNRKMARSLYVVKDIKKGEKFTSENVRSIRPSNGLHTKYYEDILGKTAKCDLAFGTPMKEEYYV